MMSRLPLFLLLATATVAPALEFELVWAKMVDDEGEFDVDLPTPQSCENAEFSFDEILFATVAKGDFTTRLLRVSDGQELWSVKEKGETESVTFTGDGHFVVNGGENNTVRIRRVEDGKMVADLHVGASTEGLRFSPDYKLLATGDEAGTVRLWDTSDSDPAKWPEKPLAVLVQGPDEQHEGRKGTHADVNQVDWTADGRRLFSAGRNGRIAEWDVAKALAGEDALLHRYGPFNGSVKCVRLSPDGTLIAGGCGMDRPGKRPAQVGVFRVGQEKPLHLLDFPDFQVFETVTWTRDGSHLLAGGDILSGGENGFISIWERADLEKTGAQPEFRKFPVHNQEYLHFNRDGSFLLTSHQDGSVRLWKVRR